MLIDRGIRETTEISTHAKCRAVGRRHLMVAIFLALSAQSSFAQSKSAPSATIIDQRTIHIAHAKSLALEHMRAGRFAEGLPHSELAFKLTEALHGADAVETGNTAHNHGFLLRRVGRADDARVLLERALAIYQRRLPPVHDDVGNLIGELGQIYNAAGRGADLVSIYAQLIERAASEGFGGHVRIAHMLTNQAFVLRGLNRADESEAAFKQAVSLYEVNGAIEGEPYRLALEAWLDRLTATGRSDASVAPAKSAIEKLTAKGGSALHLATRLHNRLSATALEAGRHVEARVHAEAALSLINAMPAVPRKPNEPNGQDQAVAAHNNLARAYRAVANYNAADANYRRAIALLDGKGEKANAGILTDNLAVLYLNQGRLDEAERYHKRAIVLLEEALGREHSSVGQAVGNLGALLNEAGRYAEAEPLLRRGLAIAAAQPTKDPVVIGVIQDNLAGLLRIVGRHAEARKLHQQALTLFEQALPPTHPRLATARNNFGRFLIDIGAHAEAEKEIKLSLRLTETIFGTDSFNVAVPASNLGELYTVMERRPEAREHFSRALKVLEASHGPSHPNLRITLNLAGQLELADGQTSAALALFERAIAIELSSRARRGVQSNADNRDSAAGRGPFLGLIEALWRNGQAKHEHAARALEIGQWDTMTPTAVALAALGARAGSGDQALSGLTRERQDLSASWHVTDRRLTELLSQSARRDVTLEAELRARLTSIETRLDVIDANLAERFPRYRDLAQPAPLPVEALRALLAPNEAAIQFVVAPDATYVWLISKTELNWHRAPIAQSDLKSIIRELRCGLDRAEWDGAGLQRCATVLGIDPTDAPKPGDPLPFDSRSAHGLFKLLLEPLAPAFKGRDLLVVASGPLTALPLQVLVTAPPATDFGEYANVAWLGRRHAITVLPSLASLSALRQFAKTSQAPKPYIGIGNPLLTGPDGRDRRAFEVAGCTVGSDLIPKSANLVGNPTTPFLRSATANVELLRQQLPLPETADELCRVARFAGAQVDDVILGLKATETEIKMMSRDGRLAQSRIVHFATHGLLAGETALFLAAKAEPSLILTPPETASETDDGLLTASEVANLKLDADWVVLSACNTAGGGEVGAEALSGLARAFFYAGARSLLVSHWAVDSDATVTLITSAFAAMAKEPGMTQGRALSSAMAALIDRGGREAHPSYWSPFVVVGGSATTLAALEPSIAPAIAAPIETQAQVTTQVPAVSAKAKSARKQGQTSRGSAARPGSDDGWKTRALGQ